ncbi:MAG TPA: hypothetical protein G4N98_06690 [Thermoflexia bacterium]|nr:hypothetical protein [Thermoflexia bacterium]
MNLTSLPHNGSPASPAAGLPTCSSSPAPCHNAWKTQVEAAGVHLYGYVPDYAFIARMDGATAEAIQA